MWGFGYTFTSGAMDAWLADEVGDERLTGVYLRGAQVGRFLTIAGIASGVGLALVDVRLPIVVGGLGTIALAAFYALAMPETGFRPAPRGERSSFGHMAETGRSGLRLVRSRPALLAILGVAAFAGMWSESYDRLWQAHLIEDVGLPSLGGLDPVIWFGILGIVGTGLSIVVAAPLGRRLEGAPGESIARTLSLLYAVLAVGSLVFALAGSFWLALVGSYGIFVARQVSGPLFTSWLNRSDRRLQRPRDDPLDRQPGGCGRAVDRRSRRSGRSARSRRFASRSSRRLPACSRRSPSSAAPHGSRRGRRSPRRSSGAPTDAGVVRVDELALDLVDEVAVELDVAPQERGHHPQVLAPVRQRAALASLSSSRSRTSAMSSRRVIRLSRVVCSPTRSASSRRKSGSLLSGVSSTGVSPYSPTTWSPRSARRAAWRSPGAAVVIQVWGAHGRCSLDAIKPLVRPFFPGYDPAAPPPPDLAAPGTLEGIASAAGLTPKEAYDVSWPYVYEDDEALLRGMLSAGGVGDAAGARA